MKYFNAIMALFILLIFKNNLNGQVFERISPIPNYDTSAYSLNPRYLTVFKNNLYFFGTDDPGIRNGNKLWKSNGTWAGTSIIKQVNNEGALYPSLFSLTSFSNFMLFEDNFEKTTWRSDGTTAGTFKIANFRGGDFIEFNNKVYFMRRDNSVELWETDGTLSGTKLVKSINTIGDRTTGMTLYKNKLYFGANDGSSYQQLWVSDGTDVGTKIFKTINLTASSNINQLLIVNNYLYFNAKSSGADNQIWRTNGSVDSTIKITTKCSGCYYGLNPQNMIEFNNKLYFKGADGNGLASQFWVSDGTDTGTKIIHSEIVGSGSFPNGFIGNGFEIIKNNGLLYFNGFDSTGFQIWKSDGTKNGTKKVSHFKQRVPFNIISFQNNILFVASSIYSAYDNQLHYIKNDSARELYHGPNDDPFWRLKQDKLGDRFVEFNNALFFPCSYDFWSELRLWRFSFKTTDIIEVKVDDHKRGLNVVYPNPIQSNQFKIFVSEKCNYVLFDFSGKVIQSGALTSGDNLIELGQYISNGVYFIQIGNSTQKLVIRK